MERRESIDRRYIQIEIALERRNFNERRSVHDRRKNQNRVEIDRRG